MVATHIRLVSQGHVHADWQCAFRVKWLMAKLKPIFSSITNILCRFQKMGDPRFMESASQSSAPNSSSMMETLAHRVPSGRPHACLSPQRHTAGWVQRKAPQMPEFFLYPSLFWLVEKLPQPWVSSLGDHHNKQFQERLNNCLKGKPEPVFKYIQTELDSHSEPSAYTVSHVKEWTA